MNEEQKRQLRAERNLARLALLASAAPGLVVAAIASEPESVARCLPSEETTAASIADLPGLVLWAWAATAPPEAIAADLAVARAALGEGTRAVVVLRPRGKVVAPPLHGDVGALLDHVDAVPLVHAVSALSDDELVRGVDVPWSETAQAGVDRAGFVFPAARA